MPDRILRTILWTMCLPVVVGAFILIMGESQHAQATTVVNFAPGVEASPTGLTPSQIRLLQTAPLNTLVLFSITITTNGTFYYGGGGGPNILLCTNGAYVGPSNWGSLLNQCKASPSSINRIEMSIGGWLDQSFLNIKNLIAANGTNSSTVLYQNLSALKSALSLDAMDYDEEYEYDSGSAVNFGKMCASVGMKVTFCPYTDSSYWQAVKTGLGTNVDYVYLQCYAGGLGQDAATWSGYFGGSVPVLPGDWDSDGDINFLNLMQTGAREACIGGWYWPSFGNGTTPPYALELYPDLIHAAFDIKTNSWQGGASDFNLAARWTSAIIPGSGTNAINDSGSNNFVQINSGDPTWTVGGLWAGDGTNATGAYVQNGSTVNITNIGGWMRLGDCSGAVGYYTLTAGTLNLSNNLTVIGESGTGVLNLNGGLANLGNVIAGVDSGGTGILNLNGALLGASEIASGSGSHTVNILVGGATFSQDFDGIVSAPIGGSGTLTKAGSGTLTFSGYNTFTGPTVVNGGTLAAAGNNDANSTLSFTASLTINTGATVSVLVNNNSLFGYGAHAVPVTINAGGSLTIGNGLTAHIKGPVNLNGGTLTSSDTGNGGNGTWNLDQGTVTVNGGQATSTISALNVLLASPTTFNVSSGASKGLDLSVPGYFSSGALAKSGAGTMMLCGTNTYAGGTTISDGTLQLGDGISRNGVVTNNITDNATLVFANPWDQGYSNVISGSGAVIKLGTGKLTLSQINSYTGNTMIGSGTLALAGTFVSIGSSALITISNGAVLDATGRTSPTVTINSGKALSGSGTILGKLSAVSGSTVNPGDAIGTLTVQNNITLAGTLVMELNRTNVQTCDQLISSAGTIAAGGTLTVTNLGSALQAGDTFHLFTVPVSGFITVNLPSLSSSTNCVWTNNLAVDGTIKVLAVVSTIATNITFQVTNSALTLSWPLDHIGWRLQTQTNSLNLGLGTSWVDVPNATNVDQLTVPIDPANASVFFRLIYP